MTNKALYDYTRKVSFFLALSEAQIQTLLAFQDGGWDEGVISYRHPSTFRKIRDMGLIERGEKEWQLTKAGNLMCHLLQEAGFKYNKTSDQCAA